MKLTKITVHSFGFCNDCGVNHIPLYSIALWHPDINTQVLNCRQCYIKTIVKAWYILWSKDSERDTVIEPTDSFLTRLIKLISTGINVSDMEKRLPVIKHIPSLYNLIYLNNEDILKPWEEIFNQLIPDDECYDHEGYCEHCLTMTNNLFHVHDYSCKDITPYIWVCKDCKNIWQQNLKQMQPIKPIFYSEASI